MKQGIRRIKDEAVLNVTMIDARGFFFRKSNIVSYDKWRGNDRAFCLPSRSLEFRPS